MDEDLEAAIDSAGRDAVFAVMKANGWGAGGAPKWVWYEAARIVTDARDVSPTPKTERE